MYYNSYIFWKKGLVQFSIFLWKSKELTVLENSPKGSNLQTFKSSLFPFNYDSYQSGPAFKNTNLDFVNWRYVGKAYYHVFLYNNTGTFVKIYCGLVGRPKPNKITP